MFAYVCAFGFVGFILLICFVGSLGVDLTQKFSVGSMGVLVPQWVCPGLLMDVQYNTNPHE